MPSFDTIEEAYRQASSVFTSPFEAELLLRKLLELDRTQFFLSIKQPFPAKHRAIWDAWVQRRLQGEPIQYILGEQEFYGRMFQVSPQVLIPRPETEHLIEVILRATDQMQWQEQTKTVVDLGTGSGVIAITLAMERPTWTIAAVDRSSEALEQARQNAAYHNVDEKITWMEGDFLSPWSTDPSPIDLVVSNPPYITTDEMATLEVQVREYEPILALDGGEEGLDAYRQIIRQVQSLPVPPTLIALEIGVTQAKAVTALLQAALPMMEIEVYPDLTERDRIILAKSV